MRLLAKDYGVEVEVVQGANHEKWRAGSEAMAVPRHSEVNENTAKAILRGWEEALSEVANEHEGEGQ